MDTKKVLFCDSYETANFLKDNFLKHAPKNKCVIWIGIYFITIIRTQ